MQAKSNKRLKYTLIVTLILLLSILFTGCSLFGQSNIVNIYQVTQSGETINTREGLETTIENIEDSVVEVYASLSSGTSCGSGVIIDTTNEQDDLSVRRYFVVTNFHVIEDGTSFLIKFTRLGLQVSADLVGGDQESDIAVLVFQTSECKSSCECKNQSESNSTPCNETCEDTCKCGCIFKGVKFASSDTIRLGQTCIVIGNPLGSLGGSVSIGNVSFVSRSVEVEGTVMNLIQTTATINSGNSGGGMFDTNGNLIGIVNAKASGDGIEGIGFAIPSNEVMDKFARLIATSKINDNGVVTEYGYIEGRTNYGLGVTESNDSVYVTTISSTSVFNNLKGTYSTSLNGLTQGNTYLQKNDRIVKLNNQLVTSLESYNDIKQNFKIGDTVTLVVARSVTSGFSSTTYYITLKATLSQFRYSVPN